MISNFYEGKTLLITGCTGFLGKKNYKKTSTLFISEFNSHSTSFNFCVFAGKVVLEKICRSLPHVKTIYLSIKPLVS